jgi:hypothetical protein
MMAAVNEQKTAVNKSADSSRAWTALSKAIQIGDAQGTAGMQWATAGQLNKAQSEIGNKFAPQFADIESQRQTGLGQAAQLEQGIPTALSNINKESAEANYNNALARQTNKPVYRNYNSNSNSNNSVPTPTNVSGPGSRVIDPITQKFVWKPSGNTSVTSPLQWWWIGVF